MLSAWCRQCGAHLTRCSCKGARPIQHTEPTREEYEGIVARRLYGNAAQVPESEFNKRVDAYIRDINNDCITETPMTPPLDKPRAVPFGIVRAKDDKALCVFVDGAEIDLVLATGKLVTMGRHAAAQLARLLSEASTFRKATDLENELSRKTARKRDDTD